MAAFCLQRGQEITDNLIELLIQIIQRIGTRAERRIHKELVAKTCQFPRSFCIAIALITRRSL